jgi:formylglycine-generating enzyme required for sulfatase activity
MIASPGFGVPSSLTVFPCADNSVTEATVGRYQPNAFGLFDVIGNAEEFVADCPADYNRTPTDGSAATGAICEFGGPDSRILRGGSMIVSVERGTVASRGSQIMQGLNGGQGLRVARDLN